MFLNFKHYFLRMIENLKSYFTRDLFNSFFFFMKNLIGIILVLNILSILIILFSPNSWTYEIISTVYCSGNDDLNKMTGSLNELKEVVKSLSEDGVKHTVEITLSPESNKTVLDLGEKAVTGGAIYAGLKIAQSTPSVAGKVATVAATVAAVSISKGIFGELNKDESPGLAPRTPRSGMPAPGALFKININTSLNSDDTPSSPTDNEFKLFSMYEPSAMDSITTIETTDSGPFGPGIRPCGADSLIKVLNYMVQLSELSIFLLIMLGLNLFIFLVDIEKIRWLNSRPKLLNYLNKFKTTKKGVLLVQYCTTLFSLMIIYYGLSSILFELLRIKTLVL